MHIRYSFISGGAKMLFFWLPWQKQHSSPKVNKLLSIEEIICTTGRNKLPGLPQRSRIWINIWRTGSIMLKSDLNLFPANVREWISLVQQFSISRRTGGLRSQLCLVLLHEREQMLSQGIQHQRLSGLLVPGNSS